MNSEIDQAVFAPDFLGILEGLSLPLTRSPRNPLPGGHLSRRHGASLEFSELRPYEPGEDLRTVDWNAYLRLQKLFVRRYAAERSQDVYILLDTSRSMGVDTAKFTAARRLAGACGFLANRQLDRVTVVPFADALNDRFVQTRRGTIPLDLLAYLSGMKTGGRTSIGQCAFAVAEQLRRGALVIFITDLLDDHDLEEGLHALALRNADAAFFHVYTGEEERPDARGAVTLLDEETRERYEVTVDRRTARAYAETFGRFVMETRSLLKGYGAQYIRARIDVPLEQVLLSFIEPRERLRGGRRSYGGGRSNGGRRVGNEERRQ
ncbi:MAG: DUF58 domain-containing protein [Spirochaetota bacterium]